MFATPPDAGAPMIEVFVDGVSVMAPPGASAAAAVLLTALPAIRTTAVSGAPRLPYCMMGVCFDCLAVIDGIANRQSCMVPVTPGMRIARQCGARQARPEGRVRRYDLAVIGAGPAGMAAAIQADAAGLSAAVFDEQPAPGGQVFRGVEASGAYPALGGDSARAGAALIRQFRAAPGIDYRPRSTVWHIAPHTRCVSVLQDGCSAEVSAQRVLVATGAQERPVPIPGWTLPGVMTAGAAQIMLKTVGAVPQGRTVLAGQGPLAWLLAAQLLRAGLAGLTFLETTPRGTVWQALGAPGLWRGWGALGKGVGYVHTARRLGLRRVRAVTGLRAEGDGRVHRVSWHGGTLPCDTLLLHEGIIPSTHITRALGLEHAWDDAQACWRPVLDPWGATSHPWIAVSGDGAGIGGWESAMASGRLAALDAAFRAGRFDRAERDAQAAKPRRALAHALALRPFLDRLYRPAAAVLAPDDDATIVCRCEEVTAGQIREAARLGATGPNQAKAYLRAGMGPCQGRMCGTTIAAVIARERGVSIAQAGALRPRAPFKPLTVGQLAALPPDAAAVVSPSDAGQAI